MMVKLNSNLDVVWANGSYGHSEGTQLVLDQANNALYALGLYVNQIMILPHSVVATAADVNTKFYTRINSSLGTTTWVKNIDAEVFNNYYDVDFDQFAKEELFVNGDITLDNEGNLYIVGAFSGPSVVIGGLQIINKVGQIGNYVFKALGANGNPIWSKELIINDQFGNPKWVRPESVVWYKNQIYVGGDEFLEDHISSFLAFAGSNNSVFNFYYEEFSTLQSLIHLRNNALSAMCINPNNGFCALVGDYNGDNLRLGDPLQPTLGNSLTIDGIIGYENAPFETRTAVGEGWVALFEKKYPSSHL